MRTELGSSPRTRGTQHSLDHVFPPFRFIPAYAGNSPGNLRIPRSRAVHPRVRGELRPRKAVQCAGDGSSPRTRGTLHQCRVPAVLDRFIPAYAGNSVSEDHWAAALPVHPRVRGELSAAPAVSARTGGSSPRTRGTRWPALAAHDGRRFIPAYAGNSPLSRSAFYYLTVHPRVRGELASEPDGRGVRIGSSPRTRGTQRDVWRRLQQWRFIPAYAGNSRYARRTGEATPVHPRVRGELPASISASASDSGSSPRTRGTHVQ